MSDQRPVDLATVQGSGGDHGATGAMRPTALPPAGSGGASVGGGRAAAQTATVWNNSQTVNALWSINQDKNVFMGIAGLGWQKLSNASESGIMSLNLLAAHAKQLQTPINFRQESDGMVHEIYAW